MSSIRKLLPEPVLKIFRPFAKKRGRRFTAFILKSQAKRYGWQIGAHTYGKPKVWQWGEGSKLSIGRFCSIGDGVNILLGGNHRIDWVSTYTFNTFFRDAPGAKAIKNFSVSRGDVVIGNDVWIANGATILSGVTIGHGAAIGAGAMVTKNVAPYTVVAGNPARVIKERFSPEIAQALLDIAWWDWPTPRILAQMHLLQSGDIEGFIKAARAG